MDTKECSEGPPKAGSAGSRGNDSGTLEALEESPGTSSTPVLSRRVDHVHKLERKHSSGDLHSRLKTRKLLGVGETDDGDVHRSKLSQILGHSEQLFVRLPRGLRIWQLLTAIMFSTVGAWALVFPSHLFRFAVDMDADVSAILPIRLYGGALISLSVVFWCTIQSVDKDIIRWSLLGSAVYFIIQVVVSACCVAPVLVQGFKLFSFGSGTVLYLIFTIYFWLGTGSRLAHHAPQYKVERSK